jgi:hypothetical protein
MDDHSNHDSFAIKFYNQGLTTPTTIAAGTSPSATSCPHHSILLQIRQRQPVPPGVHPLQRLDYTPLCDLPVSLSGNCRVGTSTSAGCTCGHTAGPHIDDMARELDTIVQESRRNGSKTSSRQ